MAWTPLTPGQALSDLFYQWRERQLERGPMVTTLDCPAFSGDEADAANFASLTLRGHQLTPLTPSETELQHRGSVRAWDRCADPEELLSRLAGEGRWARVFSAATISAALPWSVPPLPPLFSGLDTRRGIAAVGMWSIGDRLGATARAMQDAFTVAPYRRFCCPAMEVDHFVAAKELLDHKADMFAQAETM